MQDNITPEERLLRLIRKDNNQAQQVRPLETVAAKPKRMKPPRLKSVQKIGSKFSFESFSRILLLAILILGGCLLIDFIFMRAGRIQQAAWLAGLEPDRQRLELAAPETIALTKSEPLSYYSQPIQAKNLFTAKTAARGMVSRDTLSKAMANLKLQGIILEPNPQAIIEDSQSKETYFLSPGEAVGEIQLKQILPGKVVLDYQGQEVELSL